jgi:DNA-binding XRE family transcriptional regulator
MATPQAKKNFARWLLGFRAHTEQTQAELALVIGVHRITVVRYEGARLYPSRDTRIKLNELAREANYPPVPPYR